MSEHSTDPCGQTPTWATRASTAASAESLTALAEVDAATMDGTDLVDAIVASEKALSLLAGTQMRLLAALAQPFIAGDPMRLAARLARKSCLISDDSDEVVQSLVPDAAKSLASAEVAAALRISPVTAGIRVREADSMTTVLAPTLAALENGVLDRGKARIIAEQCDPLKPEDKAAVQELVLPLAGAATSSELRDLTGQAVITVDPDGCEERHKAAAARRELAIKALPDAMATLKALLPADGAVKIFQLADLLATATAGSHGDERGIGARRIDALVDVADQLLTLGSLDLSHYLGNPLPDHGFPGDRAAAGDCHGGEEGGARSGSDGEAGVPLVRIEDITPPEPAADTASPDSALIRINDTTSQPIADCPAPGTTRSPTPRPDVPPTRGAGFPTDDSQDSDSKDIPEPIAVPSPIRTTKGINSAGRAKSVVRGGSDKPCESCGSVGGGARSMTRQGRRPHLSVTLGLGTLAGLDNLPGKLAGFGAIPPGLARSIAKSAATIIALLTDSETGSIAQAGALVYRPRQALRDQIAALLETCQFPSCRQPVWRCDIDHREPFDHQNPEQGGPTTQENTGPYCRRHHLFKHHTEWQVRPDPNCSTLIWISPTGHRYVKGRSQAAPPDIWVSTGGTDLAERLDTIKATVEVDNGPGTAGSVPEELLTAMLLRHELNRPPFEYDPAVHDKHVNSSPVGNTPVDNTVSNDEHVNSTPGDNTVPNGKHVNNTPVDNTVHNDKPRNGYIPESDVPASDDPASDDPASDVPGGTVPRADSWPTFDDPPPF